MKKIVAVVLSEGLHRELKNHACDEMQSMSAYIRALLLREFGRPSQHEAREEEKKESACDTHITP